MKRFRLFFAVLTAIVLLLFATAASANSAPKEGGKLAKYSYTLIAADQGGTVEVGTDFIRTYVDRHPPSQPYFGTMGFGSYCYAHLQITRTGGGSTHTWPYFAAEVTWGRDHALQFIGSGSGQVSDAIAFDNGQGGASSAYGSGWKTSNFTHTDTGQWLQGLEYTTEFTSDGTISIPLGPMEATGTLQLNSGSTASKCGAWLKLKITGVRGGIEPSPAQQLQAVISRQFRLAA